MRSIALVQYLSFRQTRASERLGNTIYSDIHVPVKGWAGHM